MTAGGSRRVVSVAVAVATYVIRQATQSASRLAHSTMPWNCNLQATTGPQANKSGLQFGTASHNGGMMGTVQANERQIRPSNLLEPGIEQRMGSPALGETGAGNSNVETVGTVDWTKVGRG